MSVLKSRGALVLMFALASYANNAAARFIEADPIGVEGGINVYVYVEGNPLTYMDPLVLWPFGAPKSGFYFGKTYVPSQQEVNNQLQNSLMQSGACKDKAQAQQIASDITDEVGWGDLGLAQTLVDSLNSGKPLTEAQQAAAQEFINKLPVADQGPLKKLLGGAKK